MRRRAMRPVRRWREEVTSNATASRARAGFTASARTGRDGREKVVSRRRVPEEHVEAVARQEQHQRHDLVEERLEKAGPECPVQLQVVRMKRPAGQQEADKRKRGCGLGEGHQRAAVSFGEEDREKEQW